jgi:CheY-like chemotaxis protein
MVDTRLPGVDGLSLIRGLQFQTPQKTMHVVAISDLDGPTDTSDAGASMPGIRWVRRDRMEKDMPMLMFRLLTCGNAEDNAPGV